MHDFVHVLVGEDVGVEEELRVKWFEMVHYGMPSTALAVLFGPVLAPPRVDNNLIHKLANISRMARKCRPLLCENLH